MMPGLSYDEALALLHAWTPSDALRRHAYAVEAAMEAYAVFYGQDVEVWKITGLLHDMDYERHPTPEEHPYVGVQALRSLGVHDDILQAILGHAAYTGVERTSLLAKCLFAVDELAGFITAVAYVRPDGLMGLTPKSVKKKLKDKAFAAAVSREDIRVGVEELGIELDEHIQRVIDGMAKYADRILVRARHGE